MSTQIPVIDFADASSAPHAVATRLLDACTEWGFLYVKNHPIPQSEIDGIFELQKQFFAQPLDVKCQAPYIPSKNAGYKPASSYGADNKFTDPREAISINKWPTPSHTAAAVLPPLLSEARGQIASFQQQVWDFTTQLLELIAEALDLPRETLVSYHDPGKENFDNFELMHYPPVSDQPGEEGGARFRISPHTDWGTLTLLFQSTVGGLEVRPPEYVSASPSLDTERWTPAAPYQDFILINIGDMLEFWTAGRLKSTWHRVVPNGIEGGEGAKDRFTFAYFLHPNKDAVLVPMEGMKAKGNEYVPRYEGIGRTAEEHIQARIRTVHGVGKDPEKKE